MHTLVDYWSVLIMISLCFAIDSLPTSNIKMTKYIQRHNARVKDNRLLEEHTTWNVEQCTLLCANTPFCATANWNDDTHTCLLSSKYTTDDIADGFRPTRTIAESGWSVSSEVRYKVMSVTGKEGQYTLTFDSAQKACRERGMSLASINDLQKARDQGYDFCSWGWTSDNVIGMVLQEAYSWCIRESEYHSGFIIGLWMTYGNAYCKTKTL